MRKCIKKNLAYIVTGIVLAVITVYGAKLWRGYDAFGGELFVLPAFILFVHFFAEKEEE